MRSNFDFLKEVEPFVLYRIAKLAETYLFTDPNGCLVKLRQFAEVMVNEVLQTEHIALPYDNTQANRINLLKREEIIEYQLTGLLHQLRLKGNEAVHGAFESVDTAKTVLQMAFKLAEWYALNYGEGTKGATFIMPSKDDLPSITDLQAEKEAQELQIKLLNEQLVTLQKEQSYWEAAQAQSFIKAQKERKRNTQQYSKQLQLSEAETRKLIDAQLCEVGWEADSETLRYSKGTRPQKGRNIAIAEWPTDKGVADYALFAGLQLVGIVEAKPKHKDISAIIAQQCKDYATHIKTEHKAYLSKYRTEQWGNYQVPFLFATNGRYYLKQLETKSGIWFLDTRSEENIPKALQHWKSPQGLLEDLLQDKKKATLILAQTPYDLLRDPKGLNLREYQIRAVETTEKALAEGRNSVLLSMATGTGKTRTLLAMIYRFLKTQRFKRILFLVDRNALGEQAFDVFKEVKLDDLQTLHNIYTINGLSDKTIEKETKIHLSTVQAMVRRILYNESDKLPTVSDYDLVIIDEAHRGYILDKEMSEDEFAFRNQDDFISKYTMVIDYFDAVKIAVTATPALHTSQLFGKPIFEYSYREAVLDGFLVDYNLPHHIFTKQRIEGIHYSKGDTVQVYDPEKNEVINLSEIPDELNFEVEQFNRNIIVEGFNRAVLEEIAQFLDPTGEGKTLIFAVDDAHADLIVKILKEIYAEQGVDNNAIQKITGSIGDKKRVQDAIKQFKNENYPNIAVTVDLLTTGIDVPEITTLVFLRFVKSRILFEQMIGRATRLCPKINKEIFEVYDPVGVFEKLSDVSTMTPIVTNVSATLEDILRGFEHTEDSELIAKYTQQLLGRLQRRVKNIRQQDFEYFCSLTEGISPKNFLERLKSTPTEQVKSFIKENTKAIECLFYSHTKTVKYKYISNAPDEVREHYVGYGKTEEHPEDYIEQFSAYIAKNRNKLTALNLLCTRPSELTRSDLKRLYLEMAQEGYTLKELNKAWNNAKNVEITADLIGMVRTLVLGNTLIDYKVRLNSAFEKLKKTHTFNAMEAKWLDRIKVFLEKEQYIEKADFDTGAFQNAGGYEKINKVFKNHLAEIVDELKEYLFEIA
ncbi:type I restriction-modification system endonuclease [Capnocytophaga sputigena]|uniref:type I restriction-modification system endonuclease n=1 Tax=Capnocytophaga sputigena TaxID=1019 RepID=UPI0028ECB58C|nr:type I restriction-modification system endonuclease [Capnocytophaga sputigena]